MEPHATALSVISDPAAHKHVALRHCLRCVAGVWCIYCHTAAPGPPYLTAFSSTARSQHSTSIRGETYTVVTFNMQLSASRVHSIRMQRGGAARPPSVLARCGWFSAHQCCSVCAAGAQATPTCMQCIQDAACMHMQGLKKQQSQLASHASACVLLHAHAIHAPSPHACRLPPMPVVRVHSAAKHAKSSPASSASSRVAAAAMRDPWGSAPSSRTRATPDVVQDFDGKFGAAAKQAVPEVRRGACG